MQRNNGGYKGKFAAMLTASAAVLLSMTAQAKVPDGIWDYDMAVDDEENIVFDFEEVEVTLPSDWEGRYGIFIDEQRATVFFYQLATEEALQAAGRAQNRPSGTVFMLNYTQDYLFMNDEFAQMIGSGEEGIYYLTQPHDMQGYEQDEEIRQEWLEMSDDVSWIKDQAVMLICGEGIADPDEVEEGSDEYILPNSSGQVLTREDLDGMNADELQMAINEIYARHHRKFATKSIQDYFNAKSWYEGTIEAAKFDESSLSALEGQNIATILNCMSEIGSSGGSFSGVSESQNAAASNGVSGSEAAGGTVMTATATVNIRSKASTAGVIMGVVPQGYCVKATGAAVNGWIPVNYNGIFGYISRDYLVSGGGENDSVQAVDSAELAEQNAETDEENSVQMDMEQAEENSAEDPDCSSISEVNDPYDLYSFDAVLNTYIPYQKAGSEGEPIGRGNGWYYYDIQQGVYIPW